MRTTLFIVTEVLKLLGHYNYEILTHARCIPANLNSIVVIQLAWLVPLLTTRRTGRSSTSN